MKAMPPMRSGCRPGRVRDELTRIERGQPPLRPAFAELAAIVAEWRLPVQLLRDLLDAFAQDVVKKRYADYPELLDYCRRSANPVGRLLLHLVGRTSAENLHRSDCICSALQLVNFWQDVAIDWRKDRVYLPQADLARFGVGEAQIAAAAAGVPNGRRCSISSASARAA
jgi:phytoene/squalene synthetase